YGEARRELSVQLRRPLVTGRHCNEKAPGFPGAFFNSSVRLGFGEGRHLGGEFSEPLHQLRMGFSPGAVEAEIEIAKRAGERDMADMRRRRDRGRRLFEKSERAAHFVR